MRHVRGRVVPPSQSPIRLMIPVRVCPFVSDSMKASATAPYQSHAVLLLYDFYMRDNVYRMTRGILLFAFPPDDSLSSGKQKNTPEVVSRARSGVGRSDTVKRSMGPRWGQGVCLICLCIVNISSQTRGPVAGYGRDGWFWRLLSSHLTRVTHLGQKERRHDDSTNGQRRGKQGQRCNRQRQRQEG